MVSSYQNRTAIAGQNGLSTSRIPAMRRHGTSGARFRVSASRALVASPTTSRLRRTASCTILDAKNPDYPVLVYSSTADSASRM